MILESIAPSARGTTIGQQAIHWWDADPGEVALLMLRRAKALADLQVGDREDMRLFASFATGRRISSLYHYSASKATSRDWDYLGHRVTWNVIGACIETAEARIAKSRPRAKVQTFGGDWDLWMKARGLGRWIDGLFHETHYYREVTRPCFRDATIFRGGVSKVFADDDGVNIDRVLPFELLVDDNEGTNGRPKNAYQVSVLPRDVVSDAWGTSEASRAAISSAPSVDAGEHRGDVIEVVEGYHVGKSKSRRVIAIAGGMGFALVDEPWKLKQVPYNRFLYLHNPTGYWGRGMVEKLVGTQIEINTLLAKVREAHKKMAGSHWILPVGCNITSNSLTNEQGSQIWYAGALEPKVLNVTAMSPETYQHLERLWMRAFELSGLSETSVSGSKPAGINSGAGLRELEDQQGQRFSIPAEDFDEFTRENAELAIATARITFQGNRSAMVRAPSTRILEQIKWADVDLKEDQYSVRVDPSNILPTLPAARIEKIQEWRDKGTISSEAADAMLGLDIPDVEGVASPGAAQFQEACRNISRMLDTGEYEAPDELLKPDLAITIGTAMYLRAKGDGAPPKALAQVLRWVDDCKSILRNQMQAAQPPPGPPGGAPGAPGMPPAPPMPGMPPDAGMPPGLQA